MRESRVALDPEPAPPLAADHQRARRAVRVEQDDAVPSGHLQVVLGADAPHRIPGLAAPAPAPAAAPQAADQPITAAGVPCID